MKNLLIKPFSNLSLFELYAILQLRNEVFIVEQNCLYQDLDDKDIHSHHLMIWQGNKLAGYTRLVPPGISYDGYASIGRVANAPAYRNMGIGKELMTISIDTCYQLFGNEPIRIGAQLYLKKFYEGFGFIQTTPIYIEDGIDHVEMTKPYHSD